MVDAVGAEPAAIPADLIASFSGFLGLNPSSKISRTQISGEDRYIISNPWNESAISFLIPKEYDSFAGMLNNIYLPSRLSAIIHKDKKSIEFIWTTYKIAAGISDVVDRKFDFVFGGVRYTCEFGGSSDRLMSIANSFLQSGPSDTAYRNIPSYKHFISTSSEESKARLFDKARSFWVHNVDLDDDSLIEFLNNLNFYISYYDVQSPFVLIHAPLNSSGASRRFVRYRHASFPGEINARKLDPQLLQFWSACKPADAGRKFLYAYRIIEHAAFFFVESAPRQAVAKILRSPHILDDIEKSSREVVAAVQKSRFDEYAKFEAILTQCVDPILLWSEIEENVDFFSKKLNFDGDFELSPLVSGIKSKDDFILNGMRNVCSMARKIRNALSHGKEERSAAVITPTSHNYEKLGPWASLMQIAAGEIILYNNL